MPRIDDWIGRDVEIVATGERGRVVGIPIQAEDSITVTISIGSATCPRHDECRYVALRHFTIRDGQEPPVHVVE